MPRYKASFCREPLRPQRSTNISAHHLVAKMIRGLARATKSARCSGGKHFLLSGWACRTYEITGIVAQQRNIGDFLSILNTPGRCLPLRYLTQRFPDSQKKKAPILKQPPVIGRCPAMGHSRYSNLLVRQSTVAGIPLEVSKSRQRGTDSASFAVAKDRSDVAIERGTLALVHRSGIGCTEFLLILTGSQFAVPEWSQDVSQQASKSLKQNAAVIA